MKVISLTTSLSGGAGISAVRLQGDLKPLGVDTQIITMNARWPALIDAAIGKLLIRNNPIFHSFNYFDSGIVKEINTLKPDIVHIHWVGAGFISPESISKIKAPIIWTLHDLWPLSGAEHLPRSIERYQNGYLKNNRPKEEKGIDLNRHIWERKKHAWASKCINFVAPSKYIFGLAIKSALMDGHTFTYIPNGIDQSIFKPKKVTKEHSAKCNLLFCAMSPLIDKNKGADILMSALALLDEKRKRALTLHIVGTNRPAYDPFANLGISTKYYGVVKGEKKLAEIYNSVDATLIPSRMETLSYVAMESLACNTPVIAFRVGGIPELISKNINSKLIAPFDIKDFAHAIEIFIEKKQNISKPAFDNKYSIKNTAREYLNLYQKVITSE